MRNKNIPIEAILKDPDYINKEIWSSQETIHYLDISPSTLKRYINKGWIEPFKQPPDNTNGHNFFHAEKIKQLKQEIAAKKRTNQVSTTSDTTKSTAKILKDTIEVLQGVRQRILDDTQSDTTMSTTIDTKAKK